MGQRPSQALRDNESAWAPHLFTAGANPALSVGYGSWRRRQTNLSRSRSTLLPATRTDDAT
jgi:hypothetical protein